MSLARQIANIVALLSNKRTGDTVQVAHSQSGAVATGSTILPVDDTIPQNTEGDQYLSVSITPQSASNKLLIEVTLVLSHSITNQWLAAALFQDTTANALAVCPHFMSLGAASATITFRHYMNAGTTSATTFKVRGGGQSAGTTTVNGASGNRTYGGVMASSITITELKA